MVFPTTFQDLGERVGPASEKVMGFLLSRNAPPAGPAVVYIERDGQGLLAAAGYSVPRELDGEGDVMPFRLPATDVATTTHVGSHRDLPRVYDALRRGAAEHGRQVDESGGVWEEHWPGPDGSPEQSRIEVFWPLMPA